MTLTSSPSLKFDPKKEEKLDKITAPPLIKELTFLANIQVYFAEFPYLHFSITP